GVLILGGFVSSEEQVYDAGEDAMGDGGVETRRRCLLLERVEKAGP
ncbi:unnamed protein product, partial [Allacma fusca]